jgi:hypothetical protein
MPAQDRENSIAIIGAGLVGGAVLRQLVLGWVHTNERHGFRETGSLGGGVQSLQVSKLCITALREHEVRYQLQKTRDFLHLEEDIHHELVERLGLVVRNGDQRLVVEGEALDILPSGLSTATVEDEAFRRGSGLYRFLAAKRPKTVVIGANLAAIIAYTKGLDESGTLVLAWLLTTLKRAADEMGIDTVAIVGTTGLGGLGTNMSWTHQTSHEMDSPLTSKILAAYGILGVLDRASWDTDSATRWILLTPGSLLGYDYLDFGQVRYFSIPDGLPRDVEEVVRSNDMSIPLYEPIEIDFHSLSEKPIQWKDRRADPPFLLGARVKCGESGDYSPLQFAALSHAFQMGFNTDVHVARILVDELKGKTTGYNQIPLGSGRVLEPTDQGQNERRMVIERLAELELENGTRSPAVYPALGSPRAQKEIVLADLLYRFLSDRFGEPTIQQICEYSPEDLSSDLWEYLQHHHRLLVEITAVIPVISPSGHAWVGPHVMYLNRGITCTADLADLAVAERRREFAILGAVDLRPDRDYLVRPPKHYETGIETLINRAQQIKDQYIGVLPADVIDKTGSAIDPRIRHWEALTFGESTVFDPVFFVIQFLGGDRPYR